MLQLYQSNKVENLIEHLSETLGSGREDPLSPENIIVQNNGVGQWVTQQVSDKLGIFANFNFQLPTAFAWDVIRNCMDAPIRADLEKDELIWQIFAQLYADHEQFPEVKEYLGDGFRAEFGSKLFHFSGLLADIYDQYQVFRQDWVLVWDKTDHDGVTSGAVHTAGKVPNDHWQIKLWQKISQTGVTKHRAALLDRFFSDVENGTITTEIIAQGLPTRISIFGIDTLAPVYLKFFATLSDFIEVSIYSFNPCMEYWGDIASEKHLAKRRLRGEDSEVVDYFESGNHLLSSMGKIGREYHELLLNYELQEHDLFVEPDETTCLLTCIHNDIFTLQNGSVTGKLDRSIQIHDCHTPLREVEVLHDQLLKMFAEDSKLCPRDIVVMTPDINKYAPFIETVFARRQSDSQSQIPHIPWSIADRTVVTEDPVIQAFLQLLAIYNGRMTASEIMDLLKIPAIHSRFALSENDLKGIEHWIEQSGIRWGLDAHFRSRFGLPQTELNSWKFGLERMLLGYAVGDEGEICFDRVGYGQIEGSNAEVLGKLAQFIHKLGEIQDLNDSRCRVNEWQVRINQILDSFFLADDATEQLLQEVRNCIDDLVTLCESKGLLADAIVDIDVIREHLTQVLTNNVESGTYLAGAVTFCTLQPMRTVPFKVVCLLGMNDGEFPRQHKRSSMDLIALHAPRLGDRNRRDDDRYLFLQSLLAARNKFYISYNGRSVIDNSFKMPSAVVCDLFDYLQRFYQIKPEELTTNHPLQPFDIRYFTGDSELFSYVSQWIEASNSIGADKQEVVFIDQQLQEPGPEFQTLSIDDLLRFYKNPSAYLLKNRLGINLDIPESKLKDDEPLVLDSLESYQVSGITLSGMLHGVDKDELYRRINLCGNLPNGYMGEKVYKLLADDIGELAEEIKPFFKTGMRRVSGMVEINGIKLSAVIDGVTDDVFVMYRAGKLRPIDRIELYVKHLFLQLYKGFSGEACFYATDENLALLPEQDPIQKLADMLNLYLQGLSSPLPFFAKSSFAYAYNFHFKGESAANNEAMNVWSGNGMFNGEAQDPYNWVIHKGNLPQEDQFSAIALKVFTPKLLGLISEVSDE